MLLAVTASLYGFAKEKGNIARLQRRGAIGDVVQSTGVAQDGTATVAQRVLDAPWLCVLEEIVDLRRYPGHSSSICRPGSARLVL